MTMPNQHDPGNPMPEQSSPAEPLAHATNSAEPEPKSITLPSPGEVITSELTGRTYTMGGKIGECNFSFVYACIDDWNNELAAKVLKPIPEPTEALPQPTSASTELSGAEKSESDEAGATK